MIWSLVFLLAFVVLAIVAVVGLLWLLDVFSAIGQVAA